MSSVAFSRVQAAIGMAVATWIRGAQRHARLVVAGVALLSVLAGAAAWLRLDVNSDVNSMIAPQLAFRQREVAFNKKFPTGVEAILVVVEARDGVTARRAARALAARLGRETARFRDVRLPFGDAFFQRNALLYLETKDLEELADRLAAAQPMLAELERDRSGAGVFRLLRRALELRRTGVDLGIDLTPMLGHLSDALDALLAGREPPDPWSAEGGLLSKAEAGDAIQVIAIQAKLAYGELLPAETSLATIRGCVHELGFDREPGMRVRITGDPILNYEEMTALQSQAVWLVVSALAVVAPLMWLAYRSTQLLGLAMLNLGAGLTLTAGFAALAVGQLNQISVGFSVMLVGLGVDAGIYLTLRAAEIARPGTALGDSLPAAGEVMGGALVSGTVTTALGFFAFVPTNFLGVAQLGLVTGVGMIASLALTLTFLPALIALSPAIPARPTTRPPPPLLRRAQAWPEHHARAICLGALALALLSLPLLPRLRFDSNAVRLRDARTESVQAFEELLQHAGTSPWTIDVVEPSLAEANEMAQRLRKLPEVADVTTLSDYVPSDQDEKREIIEAIAGFVPEAGSGAAAPGGETPHAALAALRAELARGGAADPALAQAEARLAGSLAKFAAVRGDAGLPELARALRGSLPEQLDELRASLAPDATIALANLPADVRARMIATDGSARLEVSPRADLDTGTELERFASAVERVAPEATGPAALMVDWGRLATRSMLQAVAIATVAISAVLWFQWQRPLAIVFALAPLGLASLYTSAAMVLLDVHFNLANAMVLPMLMGIGTDCAIYLTERFETSARGESVLQTATARGVMYAVLTSLASFVTLSTAWHRGIASLGQLLTLGLVATLACYLLVLPAALTWKRAWSEARAARAAR